MTKTKNDYDIGKIYKHKSKALRGAKELNDNYSDWDEICVSFIVEEIEIDEEE